MKMLEITDLSGRLRTINSDRILVVNQMKPDSAVEIVLSNGYSIVSPITYAEMTRLIAGHTEPWSD